ncbi:MAG: hypothetical protein ABIH87_03560 [bacterium]
MSFKRKVQMQYRYFIQSLFSFRLPSWLSCMATRVVLLLIIILFGSAYIVKTATTASSGYKIQDLEKQVYALHEDITRLEVNLADYSSMASIQERLTGSNMVVVSEVKYHDSDRQTVTKK